MAEVEVKIPCHLRWRLIHVYDNTSSRKTTINRTVEVVNSNRIIGKDYTKAMNEYSREQAAKLDLNVSAIATWQTVSVTAPKGFEKSDMLKYFLSSLIDITREAEESWQQKDTHSVRIGPGDKLYFYQQMYSGPGMNFALDTISAVRVEKTAADDRNIDLTIRSRVVEFVEDFAVAYGHAPINAPDGCVRGVNRWSDDTYYGHGSKYVWLVPRYTHDTTKAATSFEVRIQADPMQGKDDVSRGTGSDYRYIVPGHDQGQTEKVVEVKLLRPDSEENVPITPERVKRLLGPRW
ncbi:hypothetical protein C8Q80DRAFT_1266208 [Daedaleopsis nitida]|nr:hypothetical protein C8Q80DRAFT_1266208 [Daedaleopsis nitida]